MRPIGFDISKWQREWKESQSEVPHDFGWIKASEGLSMDPRFPQHYEELLEVPIRGAYHYFSSDHPWDAQLQYFLNLLRDKSIHMVCLDFEGVNNTLSWQFGRDAQRWINHCEAKFDGPVVLYNSPKYYHYLVNQGFRWMSSFDLLIARYPFSGWDKSLEKIQEPDVWHPALPATRNEWTFWQFSADGNNQGPKHGITREPWHIYNGWYPSIDLQVFNGTREELEAYVGINQEEPTPEEPTEPESSELREAAVEVVAAADRLEAALG